MVDPDQPLKDVRDAANQLEDHDDPAVARLVSAWRVLDERVLEGVKLPKEWRRAQGLPDDYRPFKD